LIFIYWYVKRRVKAVDRTRKNNKLTNRFGFYISIGSFPKKAQLASLKHALFLRKFRREMLKILH